MDIFELFASASNPEKAKPMSAYMRCMFPFLGIQKPERRDLSREFLKNADKNNVDWNFIFKCWKLPEREYQYLAIDYLIKIKSCLTQADISNLQTLITTKSWWDTVDSLDVVVGDIALSYPEVNDTLILWSTDDNIWLRRTAINHQLTRKGKTNTALLERIILNNLGQEEFFINKAIGWSLREFSKTNPDWVRKFIEKHKSKMSPLSVREGSKYIF
jgi:3-methyladenine DNA glycosylase AlkD